MLWPLIELYHVVLLRIVNYVIGEYHRSKFVYFHWYVCCNVFGCPESSCNWSQNASLKHLVSVIL